jgi:hypothetical protein
MPFDENLIAALETSLRQTRNAQSRLMSRLRDAENEVHHLRQEIEALENAAAKTESAIDSILVTTRSGSNRAWREQNSNDDQQKRSGPEETEYDYRYDPPLRQVRRQTKPKQTDQNEQRPESGYRSRESLSYLNQSRIPSIGQNIEPISHRFSDRTITQSCRILLNEYGKALHVNELYNLLVSGGMEFNGNNPTISIAVSLNRNRQFEKVAPGTFDLKFRDTKPSYQEPDELTSIQ